MTLQQAVKRWLEDFDNIPTCLIQKAYMNNPEELELLAGDYPELDWPCGWGTMFKVQYPSDVDWIRENLQAVAECNILVYECDECGILLAISGGGYDFYKSHWIPLYLKRGLNWHDTEENTNK